MILTSNWYSEVESDGRVRVRLRNLDGEERSMVLGCSEAEWLRGNLKFQMGRGALIQDAFPTLTPDEREFLLTGMTADEWDELFSEDE